MTPSFIGRMAWGPADHLAGFLAHGDDPVVLADRDDGGLRDDDALALDVDDDVRGAEVDANLHEAGMLLRGRARPGSVAGLGGEGSREDTVRTGPPSG
jgi:hypothetical protein